MSRPSLRLWNKFANVEPWEISLSRQHYVQNLLAGSWASTSHFDDIPDPLSGDTFIKCPRTTSQEAESFVKSLQKCPKSGLHNPLKNNERYLLYGDVSFKAAELLRDPGVRLALSTLIQRVAPKSLAQAIGEVDVTRKFLENFSGDQPRFLARSFEVPGDHEGQRSAGYRWPFGPVALVTPFNFPLEIPLLQLMGALYMGNKVLLKTDSKVSVVMEQMIRLLLHSGMPKEDLDFINCDGKVMHKLLLDAKPRNTLFTGSSKVAEILAKDLHGRIKLEDAGFDWKILGPDVPSTKQEIDYIAFVCDQDAYAYSGQKCSAQSILFVHENWEKAGIEEKLSKLASTRNLKDLTVGPVLTVTNQTFQSHCDALLKIPGSRVVFGGNLLKDHSIPECYGAWEPTAIYVPLEELLLPENFKTCTKEIFGPFQIITGFNEKTEHLVLEACERLEAHLTAAVVSNDVNFRHKMLANTVNGTTYCGFRARTTGAPQNHWFGPAGDPRAAGIGTAEAIKLVWSSHREIIMDEATFTEQLPKQS